MEIIANIIGIAGVIAMLLAYFLSQRGKMSINDANYLWLNFLGAVAVVFSLFWTWNLPSFLIESAWAAISLHSIIKKKTP